MTDDEFISSLENCTLPNNCFHHSDHVRMAFLYLCRYPALEALHRFSTSLERFGAAIGKAERYNETIAWAFLFLIRERMARAGYRQTWNEFEGCNADLLNWEESVLKKYYRDETISSDLAKRTFLFPDKVSYSP